MCTIVELQLLIASFRADDLDRRTLKSALLRARRIEAKHAGSKRRLFAAAVRRLESAQRPVKPRALAAPVVAAPVDLANIAARLRRLVGIVPRGHARARSVLRDALERVLRCSVARGDAIVDLLLARGYFITRPSVRPGWLQRRRPHAAIR
jgi:hypothetical protein